MGRLSTVCCPMIVLLLLSVTLKSFSPIWPTFLTLTPTKTFAPARIVVSLTSKPVTATSWVIGMVVNVPEEIIVPHWPGLSAPYTPPFGVLVHEAAAHSNRPILGMFLTAERYPLQEYRQCRICCRC